MLASSVTMLASSVEMLASSFERDMLNSLTPCSKSTVLLCYSVDAIARATLLATDKPSWYAFASDRDVHDSSWYKNR